MKHYLYHSLRALFLFLAVLLSLPMLAVEVKIDGINYELVAKAKQATVVKKSWGEYSGKIIIPESVEYEGINYNVTSIGNAAFCNCSDLTSVTIGENVTSIGKEAFDGCTSLMSVTIGESVTSIGDEAFSNCKRLTSVIIPNSVTSIGKAAFSCCIGLTSVIIGNSVTRIGNFAFNTCTGLTSLTIGNSVTSIGERAFLTCYRLTSVIIPNSVTSIEYDAFGCCSGLKSVTIGNSVTSIGASAFSQCNSLTSVTIPNSVKSIGNNAFYQCAGLTSISIPNSVTNIGIDAFEYCSGLTSVHISDIAAWCNIDFGNDIANPLYYAHHLYLNGEEVKDLVIPNNVTSIRKYAFSDCFGLKSVTIGNSVASIGDNAFSDCSGLKSVTIGNSVTSIGGNAFSGCSGLSSVIIGNGVTSIGVSAFQGCNGLTSVSLPNSVTSIGGNAFSACSGLTSVTIGSGVRYIYGKAFSDCPELLDVYCHAEEVPTTSSNTFDGSYAGYATLHVLDALCDSYKATEPWSGFGKIVTLSGEEPEPEDPEVKKCAAPVLVYEDGLLEIKCDTEGAEFITNVVAEDAKKYYEPWIEFNATYNIEVFAMKVNYENSDTVNVALVWVENGKVGEESGVISVEAAPVLIQANGGNLTINGVAKGCEIVVYTLNGAEVAKATATEGCTTINTGLQSGTVAIVKLGNKSVKIKI